MNIKPQSFTRHFDVRAREIITEVHICPPMMPPDTPNEVNIDECDTTSFNAIWDTGATGTVITNRVVKKCDLKPIRRTKVYTVSGEEETLVYLITIFLPNNIVVFGVSATLGKINEKCDVLIGMDIITHGDFAITNKGGKTVFTFRIPSSVRLDFAKPRKSFPL